MDSSSNPLSYAGHLFSDENTEITALRVPNNITRIRNYAFYGCTGLTSINIPSSVTSISEIAFWGCNSLKTVSINSNAFMSSDREKKKSMGYVFSYKVENYVLGDKVLKIGENAFYGCTSLMSITIPNSVTEIGASAFEDCI